MCDILPLEMELPFDFVPCSNSTNRLADIRQSLQKKHFYDHALDTWSGDEWKTAMLPVICCAGNPSVRPDVRMHAMMVVREAAIQAEDRWDMMRALLELCLHSLALSINDRSMDDVFQERAMDALYLMMKQATACNLDTTNPIIYNTLKEDVLQELLVLIDRKPRPASTIACTLWNVSPLKLKRHIAMSNLTPKLRDTQTTDSFVLLAAMASTFTPILQMHGVADSVMAYVSAVVQRGLVKEMERPYATQDLAGALKLTSRLGRHVCRMIMPELLSILSTLSTRGQVYALPLLESLYAANVNWKDKLTPVIEGRAVLQSVAKRFGTDTRTGALAERIINP